MSALLDAQDKLAEIKARLAALQALFLYDGKDKQFGYSECWGIDRTIQTIVDDLVGIEQAFSAVEDGPCGTETFRRLSEEQQDTISCLIGDIVEENVNPVNVATKDAARIALARLLRSIGMNPDMRSAQPIAGIRKRDCLATKRVEVGTTRINAQMSTFDWWLAT